MYCPKCGAHNEDADTMCNSCGQPIKKGRELAGFWRRYGANMLDIAILYIFFIALYIIFFIVAIIVSLGTSSGNSNNAFGSGIALLCICFVYVLAALAVLLYYTWFESSKYQATPGKVSRRHDRSRPRRPENIISKSSHQEPIQDTFRTNPVCRVHHDRLYREEAGPP